MSVNVEGFQFTDPGAYWRLAKQGVGAAVGTRSPGEQIVASLIIGFTAILSSSVTLGATLLIVPVTIATFTIGVLRLWDPINDRWPLAGGA